MPLVSRQRLYRSLLSFVRHNSEQWNNAITQRASHHWFDTLEFHGFGFPAPVPPPPLVLPDPNAVPDGEFAASKNPLVEQVLADLHQHQSRLIRDLAYVTEKIAYLEQLNQPAPELEATAGYAIVDSINGTMRDVPLNAGAERV